MLKLLSNLIEKSRSRRKKVLLFLGAGASIESGAPNTEQIVDRVLKDSLDDFSQVTSVNKYQKFYEILDRLSMEERHLLLAEVFEGLAPSEGYARLAELVHQEFFEVVITTNYDSMLESSWTERGLVPGRDYHIYVVNSNKESELGRFLRSPLHKIIKLHGDLGSGILLFTPEETFEFPEEVKRHMRDLTRETILFVGYSGRDRDVFKFLSNEGESVWWVNPTEPDFQKTEDRKIIQFLLNRHSDRNILFGDAARFDSFFRSLYELLTGNALPSAPAQDWDTLKSAVLQQANRYLDETRKGKYTPELYAERASLNQEIIQFFQSDRSALLLTGKSGVGKTNLVCNLAEKLLSEGNLVLLYNCGGALTIDIEDEIAKDLFLDPTTPLALSLSKVNEKALGHGKYIVIVFDAVNEFQFGDTRAPDLLRKIDGLIGRTQLSQVKFVVTCRSTTWDELELLGKTSLYWNRYYTGDEQRPLEIQRFTAEELERAYVLYQRRFDLLSNIEELSNVTREKCKDPLMLRMLSEVYMRQDVPKDAPTALVFQDYYQSKVRQPEDDLFLDNIVSAMWTQRTIFLSLHWLQSDETLGGNVKTGLDSPYYRMKDTGVLSEYQAGPLGDAWVKFTYDRLHEYVLARHLLRENSNSTSLPLQVEEWIKQSREYSPLWGAAQTLLLLMKDDRLFLHLSESSNYETRDLVVNVLTLLYEDAPSQTLRLLNQILKSTLEPAKRVALNVAYNIGQPGKQIFIHGATSTSETTRQITANYIYLLWRRDPDFGFDILTELEKLISFQSIPSLPMVAETMLRVVFEISLNYVHDGQVIGNLSMMVQRLATKLWLTHDASKGLGGGIAKTVRNLMFPVATKVMAAQVTTQMLLGGFIPIDQFLASTEERTRMRMVVTRVGKDIHPNEALDEIKKMVSSNLIYPNSVVAGVLASLLARDPDTTIPLLRNMFNSTNETIPRLSILLSCMVLTPTSQIKPTVFLEFLDELTRRFVAENRDFPTGGFWTSFRPNTV